jgi:hypothetical protein
MGEAEAKLGIDGNRFTLDGTPTFLLGMSYYGALGAPEEFIQRDMDDLEARGFNWVRVWATWAAHDNDVSAVDRDGEAREPGLKRLLWLVGQARRRGIVVDVTLARGDVLSSHAAHLSAVRVLAQALKPYRNVYIDVANERSVRDKRFVSFEEVRELRDAIRKTDPERLVTASDGSEISPQNLEAYIKAGVDFVAPHRPRTAQSSKETAAKTREYLQWMRKIGRVVPVHYQEPFRRDYSPWQPSSLDFLIDLRGAKDGGAAGWCLHNGNPRGNRPGKQRSFDLRKENGRLFDQLDAEECNVADRAALVAAAGTKTWVALSGTRWYVNGKVTCPGAPAEGLLMNVRMVNAVFEDANEKTCPAGFDAEANTKAFLAHLDEYARSGVGAFTLCLQGGMPGYEGAKNSAFAADGSLRPEYMKRVESVVRAADDYGLVIILGLYYQRQDQVLQDEAAVRTGVVNAANWVRRNGFGNAVLEIANEHTHKGFDHQIMRRPAGMAELIALARKTAPGVLTSASGEGHGGISPEVAQVADFLLIHFNGTPVAQIPSRVEALRKYGKAVVCNEDDKVGDEGARAAEAAVAAGCSWGLMLSKINQSMPFTFKGPSDDPIIYAKLKELTEPAK